MKIDRKNILDEAIHNCYKEMYAKAQPSVDYDQLIKDNKEGKINEKKDGPIYNRYYLSQEEYIYIIDKYLEAYRINNEWESNINVLENYLKEGGNKDKYIKEYTDKNGNYHSGWKSYEKVPPLKDQISDIIREFDCSEVAQEVGKEIYNKVMETIENCKEFYKFDREESQFRMTMALGHSPTSNKDIVIKWWKEHKNKDIEIEERIPTLFWYYDNGYTDEELAEEFANYGDDWKKKLYDEWRNKEIV